MYLSIGALGARKKVSIHLGASDGLSSLHTAAAAAANAAGVVGPVAGAGLDRMPVWSRGRVRGEGGGGGYVGTIHELALARTSHKPARLYALMPKGPPIGPPVRRGRRGRSSVLMARAPPPT